MNNASVSYFLITEKCVAQNKIMLMKNLWNMVKSHHGGLMLSAVQSNQNVFCLLLELNVFEIEVRLYMNDANSVWECVVCFHTCQVIKLWEICVFGLYETFLVFSQ